MAVQTNLTNTDMDEITDVKKWLELQAPKVRNNVEIVDNSEGDGPGLFHITHDRDPGKFIPVIGHRQGYEEDRTVPRICVSTSFLGTVLGHSSFEYYFENLDLNRKDSRGIVYRGGFYLFEFEYIVAIKPSEKLVGDQKVSDEHWLVTYNKDTVLYKPRMVGKVVPVSLTTEFTGSKKPRVTAIYYVQMDKKIQFSKNKTIGPGCYKVVSPASYQIESHRDDENIKITKVSESEFEKIKKEVTVMESHENILRRKAVYERW